MVNWEPTGFIATHDVWTLTVSKVWNGWSWAICDGINESWEGVADCAKDAMNDAVKCMIQVSGGVIMNLDKNKKYECFGDTYWWNGTRWRCSGWLTWSDFYFQHFADNGSVKEVYADNPQ